MPVTFTVNEHPAQNVQLNPKSTRELFVEQVCGKANARKQRHPQPNILSSSLQRATLPQLVPVKNGFVDTCITAYNEHHHLSIRPDDVWMAIIASFGLYVNGHPDELQEKFVPFQRKKLVKIAVDNDAWASNYSWITRTFRKLMTSHLKDPGMEGWILPGFSTTTRVDVACASIIMMGSLKTYFTYEMMPLCGVPTVTLEGTKDDYVNLLQRLDKLQEFGEETYYWVEMLRPIIRRFASAFDGDPDISFWNHMCHRTHQGCGDEYYTGWISAFCPFDAKGKWQLLPPADSERFGQLSIDGVNYSALATDKISWGFSQMDFKVLQQDHQTIVTFVAGLMGMKVSNGPSQVPDSALGLTQGCPNTAVSPHPAWFIIEKWEPAASPTSAPTELDNLQYLLHQQDPNAFISSGIPVLRTPSPVAFPSLSDRQDRSPHGSTSSQKTPTEISFGHSDRESPRKLRKERAASPEVAGPGKPWGLPGFRRPLASLVNTHN
ncbi:hypothetical protein FRB91_004760 [Serendipita sp. 411]|nr:hypothetical protein FRB91_004760 [Serendipita sp. 411]